jgi:hypothetical protein
MCSLQDQEYTSGLLDRLGFHLDEIIKAWGATQGRGEIKVAAVNWTVVVPYTLRKMFRGLAILEKAPRL